MDDLPVLAIDPEGLEVANAYLKTFDIEKAALELAIAPEEVAATINKPLVKNYINRVYFDTGYNNRHKMRRAMDAVITKKFQDMEEAGVGSGKDIADLLALSHKMTMDLLDKEIQLEKLRVEGPRNQTNIQINNNSKYDDLLKRLLELEE